MYHTKVSFAGGSHEKAWPRSTDLPPPLSGTVSQGAVAGPQGLPLETTSSGNSQLGGGGCSRGSSPHPTKWQRLDAGKCLFSAKINKWSEMETLVIPLFPRAWDLRFFLSPSETAFSLCMRPKLHPNPSVFSAIQWPTIYQPLTQALSSVYSKRWSKSRFLLLASA